jgi:SAM-dependent methyltransferase
VDRIELFKQYDYSEFHNIGFKSLHVGHGYCPGYEEFGEGATKEKWDAIEATSHWFDEAGAWIRKNRDFLYPQRNPRATIVFVYRNPFDFVVSMFRHFEHHKDRPDGEPMSLDAFIDMVMPQYLKTYVSFVAGSKQYPRCFQLVSYESLMKARAGTLRSILRFLRRPVGDKQEAAFRAALRHTEPPVMRELELFLGHTLAGDQIGSVESVSHMRGGQVGGFREVLAPHQIARINEYLRSFDLRPEDFGVEIDGGTQPETPRREITAAAEKSSEIYNTFHSLPDDEWIELIVHSPEQPTVGGVKIPGLPSTDLQWRLVGTSGVETLRDASRFYREMKRYCRRLRIELGPASRILDFGCGFGRHLRFFLKDVPPEGLVGLDVEAEAIEACTATLPMCQFQVVDPWPPTIYPGGSYDLVFSHSVFSHLNEHIAGTWIKEFARILRPGGVLMLSTHSRVLIDYAAQLRRKPKYDHPWEERIARKAFLDTAAAHLQYERGEFLYAPTGEGEAAGAFNPTLYGNAIVSPGYVRTHWMADFELIDFVDDRDRLQQALIVMRRKEAEPKLAMTPVLGTNKGLAGSAHDLAESSAQATPRDSAVIRGSESAEVRPSGNRIVWKSETEFELEGVNFKCILADYDQHHTTPDQVILIKGKSSIELYQRILEKSPPSNVLEFGTYEGGSPVLLSLLYNLRKHVGVDLRPPVPGLTEFLASHPVGKRIHIHYRVSQDDGAAIRKIAASEFGKQPIDLIIDDASHQYAPSRRTFEIAFPLLRPGGTYVLEDWGWAHWPHFKMWEDAPGLSNLIFQLTMACAATPQLIREVLVFPGFAFITKSAASGTEELNLDALVGARGKRLGLI